MNAYELIDSELDALHVAHRGRQEASFKAPTQRKTYSRQRGKAPQRFNGIHRRRTKKIRW